MIRYIEESHEFSLETETTQYCMCIRPDGHLEHLYYGVRTSGDLWETLRDRSLFETGNAIVTGDAVCLESLTQEMSGCGRGDVGDPFVRVVHSDGSSTCDFLYESHEIKRGRDVISGLPSADGAVDEMTQLTVTLRDVASGLLLDLVYVTFDGCDVITRSARLTNDGEKPVRLLKMMSMQLDMRVYDDFDMICFGGAWAREMHRHDHPLSQGQVVNSSSTGTSGSRANPFFMVAERGSGEVHGSCYGFNLIYSGDHYEACEINSYGRMRIVAGINPDTFGWKLESGEIFQTPEAVMTYSDTGFSGVSSHMHRFVRRHIVRGFWADRERPVLLNSWEAAYFDIDEKKLLRLAKKAKECGMELFVMDDGWFGHRNDDTSSLGDWYENADKLPGGIERLSEKVNALGLEFGIWVEPEMVNEDSDLYRAHPDWAVQIPGRQQALGRHQMLLDLTNADVRDYIVETMTKLFSKGKISYVKWDMNRIMSDRYGKILPADRQCEFGHRYVLGLYEIMGQLVSRFPKILFEGCAAGGNRFDLGMLCYMPQIWASDDTDARERAQIQTGYSYGYPMSVVSSHVSGCPNHQTLRITPLETRFNIAAFGVLGYECNLCDMDKRELDAVRAQVLFYKEHRRTLQFGDYHRIKSGESGDLMRNVYQFMTVSEDGKEGLACYYEQQSLPNYTYKHLRTAGLDADRMYTMTNRELTYNIKMMGDLINTVTPVHVRPGSVAQEAISRFAKLNGERESVKAPGSVFNLAGVNLAPGFAGTGYNDQTALWGEHGSRLYIFTGE